MEMCQNASVLIFQQALISTSPNEEDAEALEQASGLLSPLKYILETKFFAGNYAKKKPW